MRAGVLALCALIAATLVASALDLPVKKVKGREYFVYKVKKGESVYGVSKQLGISRETIVEYNPQAADGLKKNMELFFPVEDFAEPSPDMAIADSVAVDSAEIAAPAIAPYTIALMLPLGLDAEKPTKANELALDFYKGFLVGIDTLAHPNAPNLQIAVYDTEGAPGRVASLLADEPFLATAAVIVAPADASEQMQIAASANERGARMLNLFNIHDSLYRTEPSVLQANIPQTAMYATAFNALCTRYEGYTPIILRSTTGRNEKEGFINYISTRWTAEGVEPVIIEYENNLKMSDLSHLPATKGEKYIVIPSSGSLAEFNKTAYVLQNWRHRVQAVDAEANEEIQPATVDVFGYPDWTAFRGEALEMLHRLEATVYSRFLDNFDSFDVASFAMAFRRWYGTAMAASIPNQALLGYDAACCLVRNMRINEGIFNPGYPATFQGIQSVFRFEQSGAGYANNALYIITYEPDGHQSFTVL